MVAITLLAMGCDNTKVVTWKWYYDADGKPLINGICRYGINMGGETQDSCNKYQIGDTIK
jgi:hypothetical protein